MKKRQPNATKNINQGIGLDSYDKIIYVGGKHYYPISWPKRQAITCGSMRKSVFALKAKTGEEPVIVFGTAYKTSARLESEDPESLVNALDKCLEEILVNIEKHISNKTS